MGKWFLYTQTLHGTAILAYIGVVWGGQCRHIWQSHGASGIGLTLEITKGSDPFNRTGQVGAFVQPFGWAVNAPGPWAHLDL